MKKSNNHLISKALFFFFLIGASLTTWAESGSTANKASEFFSRPATWIGTGLFIIVILAAIFSGNSGNPHAIKKDNAME